MSTPARTQQKTGPVIVSILIWVATRIGLPLLLLYGLLWWRADAAIEKQLNHARMFMDIQRKGTVLGLNGDIGISKLVIKPLAESDMPTVALEADRAVIHTPGLWWLIRSSLFGMPNEIPSRIGFRLDNAKMTGDDDELDKATVGGNIMFPFDMAGCDVKMSHEVRRDMGADSSKTSFEMVMTHPQSDLLQLNFSGDTPGVANVSGEMSVALGAGEEVPSKFAAAVLQAGKITYTDHGFVAMRNAYCQKQTGLAAEQFLARHVEEASRSFASRGLKPGVALTLAYTGFAKDGGTFVIEAKPRRPIPLVSVRNITLVNYGRYLNAFIRYNDNYAGELTFVQADSVAPTPVAAIAQESTPVASAVPVAASNAVANTSEKPAIVEGTKIAYDDLGAHIGREIQVATNINSVRRGTLEGTSSLGLKLKLIAAEGGYTLSIPRYSIVDILLVTPPPSVEPVTAVSGAGN